MKPRGVAYVVLTVLLAVFLLANLRLLSLPIPLNLLFTQVQAPLGLFVLVIAGLLLLVFLSSHALARRNWRQERAAMRRELDGLRVRADEAENARLVQLHSLLERELTGIHAQLDALHTRLNRAIGDSRPPAPPLPPAAPPSSTPPLPASRTEPGLDPSAPRD